MSRRALLFVDNDSKYLYSRSKLLQQEGYEICTATSPEQARQKMGQVNLAIIDVRLQDDTDDKDFSGIELAREISHVVPCIILTQFATEESIERALIPDPYYAVARHFVKKTKNDLSGLLRAIRKVLSIPTCFLVHGRDKGTWAIVARHLESLGPRVVILEEQANRGLTVIEKFEEEAETSDVAIILLTPDDVGREKGAQDEKPRARQNVIFELGYFMGKLGRAKVITLYEGDVEIPSEIKGLILIEIDPHDGWKWSLQQQLVGAGIVIDSRRGL